MDPVINLMNKSQNDEFNTSVNKGSENGLIEDTDSRTFEEDWSEVPTIGHNEDISSFISKLITMTEALDHFKTFNTPIDGFRFFPERNKFSEIMRWLKSSAKLHDELISEANLVFSLTQHGLDWKDHTQYRILQTIYRKLTGSKLDCPQRGTHWQLIGFQGTDPATDLRAVGLFGLLQLLHLSSDRVLPLGRKLYSVSNSEDQPFPLAVLSLNMTNIALGLFNTGKLNRECNANKSVIDTLNAFYTALMIYTLNAWITQKKTIKDSGYLLKDAEKYCGRNVKRVLKDLPQNLKKFE